MPTRPPGLESEDAKRRRQGPAGNREDLVVQTSAANELAQQCEEVDKEIAHTEMEIKESVKQHQRCVAQDKASLGNVGGPHRDDCEAGGRCAGGAGKARARSQHVVDCTGSAGGTADIQLQHCCATDNSGGTEGSAGGANEHILKGETFAKLRGGGPKSENVVGTEYPGKRPSDENSVQESGKRSGRRKGKLVSTGQRHAGLIKTLKEAGLDAKGEITEPRARGEENRDEASKGPHDCKAHSPTGCDGKTKVWLDHISTVDLSAGTLDHQIEWWLSKLEVKDFLCGTAKEITLEAWDVAVPGAWKSSVEKEIGGGIVGKDFCEPIVRATLWWMRKQ